MGESGKPNLLVAHPPVGRPVLVYDGDCGFCRRWVERGRRMLGRRVDFQSSQEAAPLYPEISPEAFERGVQFIRTDGRVFSNADGAFHALATLPAWRWVPWAYRVIPGVRPATEGLYRLVAENRRLFSRWDRWWMGPDPLPPGGRMTRWLFLRALALIYLIAFLSFWVQAEGLIGAEGILPAAETMEAATRQLAARGDEAPAGWRAFPTVFWWGAGDGWIHAVCAAGTLIAALTLAGVVQPLGFFLLWAGYLSLCTVGRVFMSYQWDSLLLEAGFLAVFFAPWQWRPSRQREADPSLLVWWLYRWLSFRLLWGSGLVKLSSGDAAWWPQFSALAAHYETQPLPNPLSWYVHHGPDALHRASTAATLAVELAVPFLLLFPRRVRHAGAGIMILLQVAIFCTGNFSFFNLLTIALCLLWLDDGVAPSGIRAGWRAAPSVRAPAGRRAGATAVRILLAAAVVSVGWCLLRSQVDRVFARFGAGGWYAWPGWVRSTHDALQPFRIVGGYGLFALMTKDRPEIEIQGSRDGRDWQPIRFRYKPGAVDQRPAQVAPHQPRLDWQMWFAGLSSLDQPRTRSWFLPFLQRVLEGSEGVAGLLGPHAFADEPPRWVRAVVYDYRFATPAERRATGVWWTRSAPRTYCPPLRLPDRAEE